MMEIAMIGLGKMGMGIAENLLRHQHQAKGFDIDPETGKTFSKMGGTFYTDIKSLLTNNNTQQIVWLMLPAGILTNKMVVEVANHLSAGIS